MAALPQNNTPRFWLDYNDGVNDHSMLVRYVASGATLADVMDEVHNFLTAASPFLFSIAITGARASASGSNFSLPVVWSGDPEYGDGTMPTLQAPREMRWVGRSEGGRRWSLSLYGGDFVTPDNYRIDAADAPDLAATIAALEAAQANSVFVAIDLQDVAIYPYLNVQNNSYWETQARG